MRLPFALATRSTITILVVLGTAGSWPTTADAEQLGRLFSTVEQRIDLDEIRDDPDFGKEEAPTVTAVEQAPKGPSVTAVTVNGVVLRSGGRDVSWINGSRIDAGDATPDGVRVEADRSQGGSVKIRIPDGPETIALKPGQKIDVARGQVYEAYELGVNEEAASAFEREDDPIGPPGTPAPPVFEGKLPPGESDANADAPGQLLELVPDEMRQLLDRVVQQQERAAQTVEAVTSTQ